MLIFSFLTLGALVAARPARQSGPPIRPLGKVIATAAETLKNAVSARALSNGNVLVNERGGRRLLMFDSSLHLVKVVADTTSETAKSYGTVPETLLPYDGDSSLFTDVTAGGFLVIEPSGKINRVIAMPGGGGRGGLASPGARLGAMVGYDMHGHLLYKPAPPTWLALALQTVQDTVIHGPDSVPILRVAFDTRRLDTLAMIRAPRLRGIISSNGRGGKSGRLGSTPMPGGDDWAILADGTVGVVHEQDYRVDWIAANGTVTVGPKVPHAWVRMTDDAKDRFIDSVRRDDSIAKVRGDSMHIVDSIAHRGAFSPALIALNGGRPILTLDDPSARTLTAADLPDYVPAFNAGNAMADADGNLWVRTDLELGAVGRIGSTAAFDVIDRKGALVDRVQMPGSTVVLGFGRGVVYLAYRTGQGMLFQVARIH